MKCKKCGSDTLIKKGDWYECAECGAITFDTAITVNDVTSPSKMVEKIDGGAVEPVKKAPVSADTKSGKNKDSQAPKTDNGDNPFKKSPFEKRAVKNDENDENNDKNDEKKPKKSKTREIVEFFIPIVAAVVIAIILKYCVFANIIVPTGSMLNTIHEGDRLIASRLAYVNDDPQRYDIIVFKYPDDENERYVKRVIGLPGETVQIVNGIVYVTKADGETIMLDDSFVTNCEPMGNFGPYLVPENSYFVMGDNRNSSHDSRYWNNKFVEKDKILGKVKFRYYPSIGKVE